MLRFFRHIRKTLMEQNKLRTYALYAIGEIFLVVIGILIALQVNNWNEQRKARDYERTVLIELKNAAIADIEHIEGHLMGNRGSQRKQALAYFEGLIKGEPVSRDSLNDHYIWLIFGDAFQYNRGPYESIKSAGLDKISNDTLRSQIASLYDFRLPRLNELIDWRFQAQTNKIEEHKGPLREAPRPEIRDGKVHIIRPYASIDFTSNEDFLRIYDEAKDTYEWTMGRYQTFINEMKDLVRSINQVLGEQ